MIKGVFRVPVISSLDIARHRYFDACIKSCAPFAGAFVRGLTRHVSLPDEIAGTLNAPVEV